jgi:signal transduction histidine kinase
VQLPEAPVVVEGWEPGVRLIADNLVENAARHGRRDGRVRVELSAAGTLTVDDDGAGVPAGERQRIFEPFVRVEGNGRGGSGLGLALVEQQARHHGARLSVGESPLGGARFSVAFALRQP